MSLLRALVGVFGVHRNANGWAYSWWSGFGSCLAYLGALGAVLRHVNCHERGCWRVARHPVGDGRYKVCHRHHPDGPQRRSVTHDVIVAHHEATKGGA